MQLSLQGEARPPEETLSQYSGEGQLHEPRGPRSFQDPGGRAVSFGEEKGGLKTPPATAEIEPYLAEGTIVVSLLYFVFIFVCFIICSGHLQFCDAMRSVVLMCRSALC